MTQFTNFSVTSLPSFWAAVCSSSDTKVIVVEESVKPASTSSKVLQVHAVTHCGVNFFSLHPDHLSGYCEMLWIHSHMSSSSSLLAFFLPPPHRLTLLSSSSETLKFNSYRRPLTLFGSTEKSLTAARVLFSKFDN